MTNTVSAPITFSIRNKIIGREHPTFIVAEIGNNHNGDMDLARRLVEAAAQAGADAVKFQRRNLQEVFTKDMLNAPQTKSTELGETYGEYRAKLELTDEQFLELKDLAHSFGLAFFVTPFDLTSVEALDRIGMDAWKIASFDATHTPLLEAIARKKQPIFLSTGMATQEEIDEAVRIISRYNHQLVIKHCVSAYPTLDEDLNLGAITSFLKRYDPFPIGYSGHEKGFIPTIAAVALGARSVERHLTLDKTLPGPDHGTVSLDHKEFGAMAREIRRIERAVRDTSIRLHENAMPSRNKHGKSVVAKARIPQGTVLAADMLTCKSPGTGMKPNLLHTLIGRVAKMDIPEDALLEEIHLN